MISSSMNDAIKVKIPVVMFDGELINVFQTSDEASNFARALVNSLKCNESQITCRYMDIQLVVEILEQQVKKIKQRENEFLRKCANDITTLNNIKEKIYELKIKR